jgi:hypothetical protein
MTYASEYETVEEMEAVGLGGLTLSNADGIALKKEVLNVGWRQISVDDEFLNESNSDKEGIIGFQFAEYPVFDPYNLTHFGEPDAFSLTIEGHPAPYKTVVQAILDGTKSQDFDITKDLEGIGLTREQILHPDLLVQNHSKKAKTQIKALVDQGYLEHQGEDYIARWNVKVSYQWKQRFPAGRIVHVHHEYQPFNSENYGHNDRKQLQQINFCQDKNFSDAWERKLKQAEASKESADGTHVAYILRNENGRKNNIEDFTLNLRKESPQEMVTLCFPSEFKRIDNRTLQTHISNFQPADDLHVYFANISPVDGYNPGFLGTIPKVK